MKKVGGEIGPMISDLPYLIGPNFQVISPGFWSVTMYDAKTRLTVENPINRYSLGSDNDLKKNQDGSITIYLQTTSPGKDKESKWLPTTKGPFYMLMRNYAPTDAAFEALKDPSKAELLPKVKPAS